MKYLILFFILSCTGVSLCLASPLSDTDNKEILLRLPLLSHKNAAVITEALDTINGIEEIEACFELNVLIIGFDKNVIKDESVLMNIINDLKINSSVEKIYSSDIPIIRRNYKTSILRNAEKRIVK